MKLIIKCPECDSEVEVEEGRDFYFCKYCGTRIAKEDELSSETDYKEDEKVTKVLTIVDDNKDKARKKSEEKKPPLNKVFIYVYFGVLLAFIIAALIMFVRGDGLLTAILLTLIVAIIIYPIYHLVNKKYKKERDIYKEKLKLKGQGVIVKEEDDPSKKINSAWFIYLCVCLFVLCVMILAVPSKVENYHKQKNTSNQTSTTSIYDDILNDNSILTNDIGKSFSFMYDEWHAYKATVMENNNIRVQCYYRGLSLGDFKLDHDVVTFRNDNPEYEFNWIDPEHISFLISFSDKEKSVSMTKAPFSIIDENGSDWIEDMSCTGATSDYYVYNSDDHNQYRAIFLSDRIIKIENWESELSILSKSKYSHNYDLCVIDITSVHNDFSWADSDHNLFSISLIDRENERWKELKIINFEKHN